MSFVSRSSQQNDIIIGKNFFVYPLFGAVPNPLSANCLSDFQKKKTSLHSIKISCFCACGQYVYVTPLFRVATFDNLSPYVDVLLHTSRSPSFTLSSATLTKRNRNKVYSWSTRYLLLLSVLVTGITWGRWATIAQKLRDVAVLSDSTCTSIKKHLHTWLVLLLHYKAVLLDAIDLHCTFHRVFWSCRVATRRCTGFRTPSKLNITYCDEFGAIPLRKNAKPFSCTARLLILKNCLFSTKFPLWNRLL